MLVGVAAVSYQRAPAATVPLAPLEADVFSITSCHGRGFAPGATAALGTPRAVLAAVWAVRGLSAESAVIATFTNRFIAR